MAGRCGTGESPPIKAGHRETSLHLTTEHGTSNNTNREMEETQVDVHEHQRGLREVSSCRFCWA